MRVVAVCGTTAAGKSALAIALAKHLRSSVINTDSIQLHPGFPITTNKVSEEEAQGIPHLFLGNLRQGEQNYSVADFEREALQSVHDLDKQGQIPVLVGGTHYYLQSVLFENTLLANDSQLFMSNLSLSETLVANSQPQTASLIKTVPSDSVLEQLSAEERWNMLNEVDPVMAQKWHPSDTRRIIRSLQFFRDEGTKHSDAILNQHISRGRITPTLRFPTCVFWVHSEKDILRKRMDNRVLDMMCEGMLEEADSFHRIFAPQAYALENIDKQWRELLPENLYTTGIGQAIGTIHNFTHCTYSPKLIRV